MRLVRALLAAGCLLCGVAPSAAGRELPAFPGAQGWGASSVGGRGGRILQVTSLADRGPGSLRAAIETPGPRIVVFRVAGYIDLETPLLIEHPFLTIAGQTAPGDGVVLRMKPGRPAGLRGVLGTRRFARGYRGEVPHDLIVRHLRIRHGRSPTEKASGGPRPHNLLLYSGHHMTSDHLNAGWTNENLMTLSAPNNGSPPIHDVTVQRSIFAEALEGHATGMNVQGQRDDAWRRIYRISLHHNLFAHNSHRNPRATSGGTEVINNVTYNWRRWVGSTTRGSVVDWIANYWKPGPMSNPARALSHEARAGYGDQAYASEPSIYVAGNVVEGAFTDPRGDNWPLLRQRYRFGGLPDRYRRRRPLAPPEHPVRVESARAAYASVLADVGANRRLEGSGAGSCRWDAVDARVLAEVAAGTGTRRLLRDPQQLGGFPPLDPGTPYPDDDLDGMADAWERLHFGNLDRGDPQDSSGDSDGDGYTDVEEFLNATDPLRVESRHPGALKSAGECAANASWSRSTSAVRPGAAG